jgi:hypothetical protein
MIQNCGSGAGATAAASVVAAAVVDFLESATVSSLFLEGAEGAVETGFGEGSRASLALLLSVVLGTPSCAFGAGVDDVSTTVWPASLDVELLPCGRGLCNEISCQAAVAQMERGIIWSANFSNIVQAVQLW